MLKYVLTRASILTHKSDCLLLCLSRSGKKLQWSDTVRAADKLLDGWIKTVCRRGDFSGKAGETIWLHTQQFSHKRVLLVGLGEDDESARVGMRAACAAIAKSQVKTVMAALDNISPSLLEYMVIAAGHECYQFHRGGYFPESGAQWQKLTILPPRHFKAKQLALASAVAEGVELTCHLAEQPGNIGTPNFLAAAAVALAKKTRLRVTVIDEKRMKKLGMGALLAVAQGSVNAARLVVLEHHGGKSSKPPIVLVGKGVTFDTGGISLKPAAAMDEMKFDMSGAAAVFGVMLACERAKLPLNIIGIVPACENMPDGGAIKPGDVITAMSGKTIEILNTDAEGRLILADALTYAEKFKPATVIDIATLTGACVIALGHHRSGLMGRGDQLLEDLQSAGDAIGDPCWPLPMGKYYQDQLKTDYADIANIGGRSAGTITAACFLSNFTDCPNWAHLDIAGVAWTTSKRATGRPVPLLMRYLLQQSEK